MKKWVWVFLILIVGLGVEYGVRLVWRRKISEIEIVQPKQFPYLKYSIVNLGMRNYSGSEIIFDEVKSKTEKYYVEPFSYMSDGKKVTGIAHISNGCSVEKKCPVIVQFRGYAEVEGYYSGYGTSRSAQVFANNGYITLAPDFLGYGGSDMPDRDVWIARFETYTSTVNLLESVKKWEYSNGKIGIWGHSNGGQIALTVLEITQGKYATVVWNPVSVYFPYSVLYFTDDNDDEGVALRKEVQRLENEYNLQGFSLTVHLERINAPILLQQGSADESVPQKWSDALFNKLKSLEKDVDYQVYPGADHNMVPGWEKVIDKDLEFYKSKL